MVLRIRWITIILVLVLAMASLAGLAAAATLKVGPGGGFPSIASAIEAAAPGDTITVAAGTYRENLVIEKPITLTGQERPHIKGDLEGDVVLILADDVTLRGFAVSGSGRRMMVSDAGIKIAGARAKVLGNDVFDNLFGIYLKGCSEALVEENEILGRREDSLGMRGAGIHFYDAHDNIVRSNRVSFVRDGVYFDHADRNRVEGNEFSHLRYGVHYMYCEDNTFVNNIFRDSLAGVAVMYTERVTFRDNQIFNNRQGYNAFGLLLKDCLDSVAEGNVIVNNVNGIFLDSSHRNFFRKNLIAYNDVAVLLHASSLQNSFGSNDFVGNLATLHTVGRADADWSPEGKGNYYSDYTGYDLDGDGRGDIPHRLQDAFEYLEGSRPRLRLFLNSAAADALAMAEQSFPLVPSSEERDLAPSMRPVSGIKMTFRYGSQEKQGRLLSSGALMVLLLGGLLSWRLRG
ncbi:MAG: nitrous oxide reductase family maturation protein NosD [Planctomycetota bacterium]|jgi:nitrous oxidase accessory protein